MDHTHKNLQKTETEWKVQQSSKNGPRIPKTGGQWERTMRHNQNFFKLWRKTEESIWYKSDPERNVVDVKAFSFPKSKYDLLNKNLNFISKPKVYNKKEVDNDLNKFFRLTKLKTHFKH